MNYPLKVTPEQYWSIQFSMLERLSWLHMTDELRQKITLCLAPLPGYFTEGEFQRYIAQAEGSLAEEKVRLNTYVEKMNELEGNN
jgi:hypothetical protein